MIYGVQIETMTFTCGGCGQRRTVKKDYYDECSCGVIHLWTPVWMQFLQQLAGTRVIDVHTEEVHEIRPTQLQ